MQRRFRWIVIAAVLVTLGGASSPVMAIGYLSGVLQKPAYVQTLTKLRDAAPLRTREILKRNGAYVSSSRFTEQIAGTIYELFDVCTCKCVDTV